MSKKQLKKPKVPDFSTGMYQWSLFLINLFLRVKKNLKIDYDSFMIMHIVFGYHLNQINKDDQKSFEQLSFQFENSIKDKTSKTDKLTVTSIASALDLPRETVKRKVDVLIESQILGYQTNKSITLGARYKELCDQFILESTHDIGKLLKRWESKEYIDKLIKLVD